MAKQAKMVVDKSKRQRRRDIGTDDDLKNGTG